MTAELVWLGIGLLLCLAELAAPGVYLLWLGLAACGVGLVLLLTPLPFTAQIALFAVIALVAILAGLRLQRRGRALDPNAPGADLIGEQCLALTFNGSDGRVRLRDAEWPARASSPVNPGDRLIVTGLDGTRLLVRCSRHRENG